MSYIVIFRLNLKWCVSDLALIIFSGTVADSFKQCLVVLPFTVLMAKICPKRIEATSFAVLAGIANFRNTLQGWIGSAINEKFVGVTKDDLSKFWILVTINFVCSFLPLLFLWLIPTKQ